MVYSFAKTRMHGPLTRILCCTDEDVKKLEPIDQDVGMGRTHIAPSWTQHPYNGEQGKST